MLSKAVCTAVIVLAAAASPARATAQSSSMAFATPNSLLPLRSTRRVATCDTLRMGGMEQIEFVIYPDGRVEEKVTGVKGKNCVEITAKIEEQLGKVTYTQPTSEMFEEEIKLTTKETQKNSLSQRSPGGGNSGGGNKWTQF